MSNVIFSVSNKHYHSDNTFKIINHLQENYIEYGLPSHTLEFHPCLFFMDTSFALSKESFKQIPHADEHIAALQEMYKVVSASPPPKKSGTTISFFTYLADSDYVYTAKESENILENYFHSLL